ncbi:MAG: hypothetical protein A2749_01375 [Parcubacteria group bacterium RIFCSPHIGHO2_01_FULL_45_26]|nr:MAG: hypothetical protein A2749_01375 [Parcubacteria group bacterium RIFCSPHIGHO2_01_FULL_45_26]
MRHHNNKRKFGRKRDGRNALLKSLAEALVTKGGIRTTLAKAKELRPYVEKMVTKQKFGSIAMSQKVKSIGTSSRKGGYTRISKLPRRFSDSAKMAIIKFV